MHRRHHWRKGRLRPRRAVVSGPRARRQSDGIGGIAEPGEGIGAGRLRLCLLKTPYTAQSLIISRSESSSRSRMLDLIFALLAPARSSFKGQRELALENLALR